MKEVIVDNVKIENEGKLSLDERVKRATLENYEELMSEISTLMSEVVKEGYVAKLAKVLGVKPATLMKELGADEMVDEVELCALFPELVDLVEDDTGKVGYLVKQNGVLSYVDSWDKEDGTTCYPPGKEHLQYRLGNYQEVQKHYARNEDPAGLYNDLVDYFKRFSYLPDDTWPLIVFSVFLSYLQDHEDVRYVPVIYFYAVAERGKSRTAKSMLSVSYRGVHLGDMNSANIFRYSQNQGATLFLDCTDLWKTAMKAGGEDILLNRFEKGATVPRVLHPDRGAFHDQVHYKIFGSTIVATNEPASNIFESRCLSITMPNRPGEYENGKPEMGIPFKERLIAWRARMMDQRLPDIRPVEGVAGRIWDISKPLFQLCQMIKPEIMDDMHRVLLSMADKKAEDKKESIEGQIVAVLDELADFENGHEVVLSVSEIRDKLNETKDHRYQMSAIKVGFRLNSLSLRKKTVNGCRYVVMTKSELDLLKNQFGLIMRVDVPAKISEIDEEKIDQVESGRECRELLDMHRQKSHYTIDWAEPESNVL